MFGVFQRAAMYHPLSPVERALLRLVEGLVCTALVAALPLVADALAAGAVNWGQVGRAALAAGAVAVLLALSKYARAQGDPALGDALAQTGAVIAHDAGISDSGAGVGASESEAGG